MVMVYINWDESNNTSYKEGYYGVKNCVTHGS